MSTNITKQPSSVGVPTALYDTALGGDIGLPLNDLRGHRLCILAPAGQTLAAAGTMRCYLYHRQLGLWMRNPDLDVSVSVTGSRGQAFPDTIQAVRKGDRVFYLRDGVTLSGTSTTPAEQDLLTVVLDGEEARP